MFRILFNEFQDKKLIKDVIRLFQYRLNGWNKVQPSNMHSNRIQLFEYDGYETFLGYYDRSPINKEGKYLLFHKSALSTKLNPRIRKSIKLVLWNLVDKREEKTWEIYAYNWQQGCKPQWIDSNRFIYNNYDIENDTYYSTIIDVRDLSTRTFDTASYESAPNFYLTLNFSRLAKFRPDYGYRNMKRCELDDSNDGIFINHYDENKTHLLISIKKLCELNPKDSMKGAKHKVNHIMLSDDNSKFMFMHRWITQKGKEDRLYVYDFVSNNLHCVADYGMVSHCFWYGNDIVGYMNGPNNKPGYYYLSINGIELLNDKIQHFGDGHPSILGNEMVFDTYPDSNRLKHLYKYNFCNKELVEIGQFKESMFYENQCRCDLHPRFITNKLVSIDSTHSGKRSFCLISLNKTN